VDASFSENVKEMLLKGFFSEYLPPCFKLDKKMCCIIPIENCDLVMPYCFTMSRYTVNDARRNIYIPEIGAYAVSCNYIIENKIVEEMIAFTKKDKSSFSPILGEDGSVMLHEQVYMDSDDEMLEGKSSTYMENISRKIIMSAGAKKILKLDISNCFSSFYMHMIPAIILGADMAEDSYNKKLKDAKDPQIDPNYTKYAKLDRLIRQQNLNRTNGLLTGQLMSKIVAEGILTRVDIELQEEGIKFSRYVDDYEVYLFEEEKEQVINIFLKVLKRYGFALNDEKTEIVDFPYYIAENLEKIFNNYALSDLDNETLMELFNKYFILEKNGNKGAIKYLLKKLSLFNKEKKINGFLLCKSYLLTIIENNERALTKACLLLIQHKNNFKLELEDVSLLKKILNKHIGFTHDLEVLWLLYLLIETKNITQGDAVLQKIINGQNELAWIVLLRANLLTNEGKTQIVGKATSWILLYELYSEDLITIDTFVSKLNLNKNLGMYKYFKKKHIHFVEELTMIEPDIL